MDTTFPSQKQRAFVENIDIFCQRKYGFPVHAKFSSVPYFQKPIFSVRVCPSYTLWSFEKTMINQFYVYIGRSEKRASAIASQYQKKEYDVYVRKLRPWYVAPEMPIRITPDFFLDSTPKDSEAEFDMIKRIEILIHESFHHHVHTHDIGFGNYASYVSIDQMSEEEVLATIIGRLSVLEYVIEVNPGSGHETRARHRLNAIFEYWEYQDIYKELQQVYENPSITVGLKKFLKKKYIGDHYDSGDIMRSPNNACFLFYYMYFGNPHMQRYKKELIDNGSEEKRKTAIQIFAKQYWEKTKDR